MRRRIAVASMLLAAVTLILPSVALAVDTGAPDEPDFSISETADDPEVEELPPLDEPEPEPEEEGIEDAEEEPEIEEEQGSVEVEENASRQVMPSQVDEPESEKPSSLELSGPMLVVPGEVPALHLGEGEEPHVADFGEGLVAVEGEDGDLILLEDMDPEGATSGDLFEGRISVDWDDAIPTASVIASRVSERPETRGFAAASGTHTANVVWFSDTASRRIPTAAEIRQAVTQNAGGYWNQQTGGRVAGVAVAGTIQRKVVSFDVCDSARTWEEAAALFGKKTSSYWNGGNGSHLIVLVPGDKCGEGSGLGSVGQSMSSGGLVWAAVSTTDPSMWTGTIAHELGHNFGLGHANELACDGERIDAPPRASEMGNWGCRSVAYRDYYSAMGVGLTYYNWSTGAVVATNERKPGPLSAVHRKQLGLTGTVKRVDLNGGAEQTLTLSSTGQSSGVTTLEVISPKTGESVFVEYRSNVGLDAGTLYAQFASNQNLWSGGIAQINVGVRILRPLEGLGKNTSGVLQRREGSSWVQWYPTGSTFASYQTAPDGVAGVRVTVLSLTSAEARVKVSLNDGTAPATAFAKVPKVTATGTAKVGSTLKAEGATAAAWSPKATAVSYQWLRDGKTISGATGATYTLSGADAGKAVAVRATAKASGIGNQAATSPSRSVSPIQVTRLSGSTRYETNLSVNRAVAKVGAPVFVATGSAFPDALSAGPAVALVGGTLTLTSPGKMDQQSLNQIVAQKPRKIYIIGGTGAVSSAVERQLRSSTGISPVRIGGKDRYETSTKIYSRFFKGKSSSVAFVATGRDYPDALTASGAGGTLGAPVLLVNGKGGANLPANLRKSLKDSGVSQLVIAGGSGAVSTKIASNMQASGFKVVRVGGANRYETNIALNDWLGKQKGVRATEQIWVATGSNFPDALSAAVPAGAPGKRLVLSNGRCLPKPVVSSWLKGSSARVSSVRIVGGAGVVSAGVAKLQQCT